MRAVGYFRAAADKSRTADELAESFQEFCRLNLHQPVKTFSSNGRTPPPNDAEYKRMVEFLKESGGQYLVLVPGAGHLGRDLESVARGWVELESLGASVGCSDEDFPNLMQNAFQTLGIKGVSRTRSQRIKESMRARSLRGQALGRPPYGYKIGPEGTFEVLPEEAKVVELIFRLYTGDGLGLRLITQHLNDRGITTRRGGRWNVVSIRDILKNPVYTGTYTRFDVRRPKTHEAIIPQELFRTAQDQTRERRPMGRVISPEPFLLSGVIFCKYCGNKMMGVTRRQAWRRKDGHRAQGVYRYYQCQSRNNQSRCGYHTWRAPLLESTVMGQLKYALMAKQIDPNGSGEGRAQAIRQEKVQNAERRFVDAMKRAARGAIGADVLGEYLAELDAARRGVENATNASSIKETLDGWESLDLETQRVFLAEHVARIDVSDDKIDVVV